MNKFDCKKNFEDIASFIKDDCEKIALLLKTASNVGGFYNIDCFFFESCIITNKLLQRKSNLYRIALARHGIYAFKAIKECNIPFGISKNKNMKVFKKSVVAGDIVYVGKTESDSIITRVNNHYKGKSSSLLLFNNNEFRDSLILIAFLLKKEFENYRSLVVNVAEKILQQSEVVLGNSNNFYFGENV